MTLIEEGCHSSGRPASGTPFFRPCLGSGPACTVAAMRPRIGCDRAMEERAYQALQAIGEAEKLGIL